MQSNQTAKCSLKKVVLCFYDYISKTLHIEYIVKIKVYDEFVNKFFTVTGKIKHKFYLKSKYSDKDEIKKLGGKWDGLKKSWYCSILEGDTIKLKKFKKWLPKDIVI